MLNTRIADAARSVPRTAGPEEPFRSLAPDPLEHIALDEFLAAGRRGLAPKVEPEVDTEHIAPVRASVRDAIDTVLALLPTAGTIRFRDLAVGAGAKLEVIVRFLAVLELFKQGVVDLEQIDSFGELTVRPLAAGERVALDLTSLDEWGDDDATTHEREVVTPRPSPDVEPVAEVERLRKSRNMNIGEPVNIGEDGKRAPRSRR